MHDSHPNLQLKTSKDEKMGRFNQKNHPWQKKIKKKHSLVECNFYFENCLLPFLAWANGRGKHWSHILTYS
jgi:hypothetical protein